MVFHRRSVLMQSNRFCLCTKSVICCSLFSLSLSLSTPMMDLLVQAASLNKLNPSGYSLVVLDSNQHVIHFKANQTVGQIGMYNRKEREKDFLEKNHFLSVKNCRLPQINGNSACLLLYPLPWLL